MGEGQMKVTADSNVLIRAVAQDDLHQARRATKILAEADLIAVPVPEAVRCGTRLWCGFR